MSKKRLSCVVLVIIGLIVAPTLASSAAPSYEGKVIRVIVGASPGGGFDLYARTLARHMGKHIPGNPTMIVENMPGGAQLISAN
jgi:tripartite-type tricarboxylate transporter receptor subunit TctC